MSTLPSLTDATSIEIFWQIPGVSTEQILANCLYTIDDPSEVGEIVGHLNPKRRFRATQRKATNWLIFKLKDGTRIITDLDQEAGELRVKTEKWIREYKISKEALTHLNQHLQKARPLYERAYN